MYKQILFNKKSLEQIRKIFSIISHSDGGVLYHCTSGKDRTGIISILLLYFLDVEYSEIRKDYFTSTLHGLASTESYIVDMLLNGFGNKIITETKRVLGISVDLLPAIKNIIEQKCISIKEYIQNYIKINNEDIRILNAKLFK